MQWRITGADRATGEDKTLEVEACDEQQAQLRAKALNVLVEKIEMTTPVPDYRGPDVHVAQPVGGKVYLECRGEMERSRASAATVAVFIAAFGFVGLIAGVVCFCIAFKTMSEGDATPENQARVISMMAIAFGAMLWSILLFGASAVLRMLAAIGLALREIAAQGAK